jgi:DNA/RNA-binding domain of Phe-tRNA-synthetase-like protein
MTVFSVSPECLGLGLRVGAIVFRDVRIAVASDELRAEIAEEVRTVRRRFANMAEVRSLPELKKLDEILRTVGVKPRSYPPSTQKLIEYALKRGSLPAVNNFVDAYNLVSLRTLYSLGAHDLDLVALPIGLRLLQGDETFRPLGSAEDSSVTFGEFAYVDADKRVICRLDSLQADLSKVTSQTANVLLIIEGTTLHPLEQVEQMFADAIGTVQRHCGGRVETVVLPSTLWRS